MARIPRSMVARARALPAELYGVLGESLRRFIAHRGDSLGSAIAFQALLATAPLLLVAVAALGLWLDEGEARQKTLHAVASVLGSRGRGLFADWIDSAALHAQSATLVGTLLFVFGASRLVVELDVAFDVVFGTHAMARAPEIRTGTAIREWAIDRARAVGLSMAIGLLVALVIALDSWLDGVGVTHPLVAMSLPFVRIVTMPLAIGLVFAGLYRWLPPVVLDWREAFQGALVTAVLFDIGVAVLQRLFSAVDVGAGYGAAGALIGVIFWLWYTAQIVVFGAEITAVIARRRAHFLAARVAHADAATSVPPPR